MSTPTPRSTLLFIILFSLILGILFDYFFYMKYPGINFPIFICLILLVLFILTVYLKHKIENDTVWLLAPLLFFSAMVAVRDSQMLTFLNIVASFGMLLLIANTLLGQRIKETSLNHYFRALLMPFHFVGSFFIALSDVLTLRSTVKENRKVSQIIRGLLLAIPALIVFLLLFSSADLIFKKYLARIFDVSIYFQPEIIFQLILILFVSGMLIGAYAYIFHRKHEADKESRHYALISKDGAEEKKRRLISNIEVSVFLGAISLLFLVFIIVQAAYLFGGESAIARQGFTYAEYARRGFFELVLVAILSFLIIWKTEEYVEKKDARHALPFKILGSLVIFEVLAIMASAFMRLSLYEDAYSFTTQRFYSHVFTIWLGAIFLLFILKIFIDKKQSQFAWRAFLSLIVFLAAINFMNPDRFIAKKNFEHYQANGKIDHYYYLYALSYDAMPETIKLLDLPDAEARKAVGKYFYGALEDLNKIPSLTSWQAFNISRLKAEQILESKRAEIEKFGKD